MKKLILLISAKEKTDKELANEVWNAFKKYLKVEKEVLKKQSSKRSGKSIKTIDAFNLKKRDGLSPVWIFGGQSNNEKSLLKEKLCNKEQKSSKKLSPFMKKALEMGFINGNEEPNAPKGFIM